MSLYRITVVIVQVTKLCLTLCDPMDCSMDSYPSLTISWNLLRFMSIELVMLSNNLIFCCFLLLFHSIFPSIRVFSNVSALCNTWPNIGTSASASVLPMNIQGWFPSGLTGLISLESKGLSRAFSRTEIQKHQFFSIQPFLWSNTKWQLTLVFLPGESNGQRSLASYSPQGCKESDVTEAT